MTDADLISYKQDGFVILRDVINKDLIMDVRSYAAEFLKCDVAPSSIIEAMGKLEDREKTFFYEFCSRMGQVPPILRIALMPEIFNRISEITSFKNIHIMNSGLFFNKEEVKRLQYHWHQEQAYYPNAEEVITLWYPWLTPVNAQNGTMVMARGGHKKIFENERENVVGGLTQMRIQDDDLGEFEKVHCDLNIGDAVLFTFMSPHKTGHNQSGAPRTTIITRYSNEVGKFNNGWKPNK